MGRLLLDNGANQSEHPLAGTCLVGRDERCDVVVRDSAVPLYWLEIRWLKSQWGWRLLHGKSATAGAGRALAHGWRSLDCPASGRLRRVRCGVKVSVALVDAAPPVLFARDLSTGEVLEDPGTNRMLGRAVHELTATQAVGVATCVMEGRPVLVRFPEAPCDTDSQGLDLGDPGCTLDLDPSALRAVFTVGTQETTVQGECVRVLLAYAKARQYDRVAEGGWIAREEAYRLWLQFGGSPDSPTERIGWEKGKLRKKLVMSGAMAVIRVFENRRFDGSVTSRISIPVDRIHIVGDS
jgi:hypothetical protein